MPIADDVVYKLVHDEMNRDLNWGPFSFGVVVSQKTASTEKKILGRYGYGPENTISYGERESHIELHRIEGQENPVIVATKTLPYPPCVASLSHQLENGDTYEAIYVNVECRIDPRVTDKMNKWLFGDGGPCPWQPMVNDGVKGVYKTDTTKLIGIVFPKNVIDKYGIKLIKNFMIGAREFNEYPHIQETWLSKNTGSMSLDFLFALCQSHGIDYGSHSCIALSNGLSVENFINGVFDLERQKIKGQGTALWGGERILSANFPAILTAYERDLNAKT